MARRKRVIVIAAFSIAVVGAIVWLAAQQRERELTMQEQLALGHDPDWVRLDLQVPEIAAAVETREKVGLSEFTKQILRYDHSLDKGLSGVFVNDSMERAQKRWADANLISPTAHSLPSGPIF